MKSGIYIHLPFCKVHCNYCDFPVTTRQSLASDYYSALLQEITRRPPTDVSDTLYFGGGTPSLTPADILTQLKSKFVLEEEAEVTLEANPDDVHPKALEAWRTLGINRLSIGIQSLEDSALKAMLRVHSAADALQAISCARDAGFDNLNVDLIIGTPSQTENGFLQGLDTLIKKQPDHFSVYFLEVHEQTALYHEIQSGKLASMLEEAQIRCYREAILRLQKAGYEHYEVSNFALPGKKSRHNLKYWNGSSYHAYGVGACSYVESTRTNNISSMQPYIEQIKNGSLPIELTIEEDKEMRMRNSLIFGLRKREGVGISEFQKNFDISPLALFPEEGSNFLQTGMLEIVENRLRLTLEGMLVSNEILSLIV